MGRGWPARVLSTAILEAGKKRRAALLQQAQHALGGHRGWRDWRKGWCSEQEIREGKAFGFRGCRPGQMKCAQKGHYLSARPAGIWFVESG